MRRQRLAMLVALVAVMAHAGCDSASTPISPTGAVPHPVEVFEIAGMVAVRTSTGLEPVAGAEVREASLSLRATTATGLTNPGGSFPGYAEIITATVRGDTLFDIELVRR